MPKEKIEAAARRGGRVWPIRSVLKKGDATEGTRAGRRGEGGNELQLEGGDLSGKVRKN